MPRQHDLAVAADMQQSRISMFETPGAANLTLETLAKLAAAFKVGLIVDFVPFSEMLRWENGYSQDAFDVTRIDDDTAFIRPEARTASNPLMFTGHSNQDSNEGILAETETNIGRIATLGARINTEVEAMSQPQMQAAAGGR
jgi:transcriptional regulator with XRE-family HTH domain